MKKGYRASKTPEAARDCLRTPPEIVAWLHANYDFTVDVAADYDNRVCSEYFAEGGPKSVVDNDPPGFMTRPTYPLCLGDGLKDDWAHGGLHSVGWCNPPFSDIEPWILKAKRQAGEGFTTVMLIPTFNGEKWGKMAFAYAREVIFITGRLSFIYPNGKPQDGNNRGTMICIFGPRHNSIPAFSMVDRDTIFAQYAIPTPEEKAA